MDVFRAFLVLPQLCRRFTDVYRAHQAKFELGLPPIVDDILVEALTLPLANARWSNQRLETLGDSVLKLATTVQLFNQYPHRHEGQLAPMRQVIVSNRSLMARAKMIELERFLTSEPQIIMSWRYVGPTRDDKFDIPFATHAARRMIPRRSLQDCMEATLGAAFLTGGIPMALHTAEALGLGLGGRIPWCERYGRHSASASTLPLFVDLQERLGYTFRRGDLLIEAVTHPSFCMSAGSASYQRLEFLGDGERVLA
jgi:endoribonuclease Dicer